MKLKGQLKTYDQLDEKEKRYYQYTCQPEDIIRICNIPSPTMTEEDLDMEKKTADDFKIDGRHKYSRFSFRICTNVRNFAKNES
mgnify:CR=1 FL=1